MIKFYLFVLDTGLVGAQDGERHGCFVLVGALDLEPRLARGLELLAELGLLGVWVFDYVRLVQHEPVPFDGAQWAAHTRLVVLAGQHAVCGQHDVVAWAQ